jgi:hypothetical protein
MQMQQTHKKSFPDRFRALNITTVNALFSAFNQFIFYYKIVSGTS